MSWRKTLLSIVPGSLGMLALAVLASCCSPLVSDFQSFRRMPLDGKIALYEKARSEKRVCSEQVLLLSAIAEHGYPAADAMTGLLKTPDPNFPPEDAATVLGLTHFKGADLRQHEALAALAQVADTASDPAVRAKAQRVLEQIERDDPTWGVKKPL